MPKKEKTKMKIFFAKACIHAKAFYKVGGSGKNSVASSSPLTVGWLG